MLSTVKIIGSNADADQIFKQYSYLSRKLMFYDAATPLLLSVSG